MPCYEVRTVSIEFKVGNIDLLKKALEKAGCTYLGNSEEFLNLRTRGGNLVKVDFKNATISSQQLDAKGLSSCSNQLKRAYSECVIDELAKKQKWIQKKMGENRFQLQRF